MERSDFLGTTATAVARLARRHPWWIVGATFAVTAAFASALVFIPSFPSSDSFDADNAVVRALDRIEDDLPPSTFLVPFLIAGTDAADGNALSRRAFDEVLAREDAIRADPVAGRFVFTYTDPNLRMTVSSVWSLADTLRAVMDGETYLTYAVGWHPAVGGPGTRYDEATDDEWQDALDRLLRFQLPDGRQPFLRAVSVDAEVVDGSWRAASLITNAGFHNGRLFAVYVKDPALASDERPFFEDFQLHVERVARDGAVATSWHGIALGINTEIQREVGESTRLIAIAFVVIGFALYGTLRNGRDFAVAYLALPLLIVWMTGSARLLGLSNNQFTAMLPILILALGVDFAIHGVRRYREERAHAAPGEALERSVSRLGPALMLAAATTAIAFGSNGFSRVPALRDWGLEGALAIASALWLSGVFAPSLRYAWDLRRVKTGRIANAPRASVTARRMRTGTRLGRIARWTSRRPVLTLGIVALVTVPATVGAIGITTDFNVNDFFDPDSEFVATLDRIEREFPTEGEPAIMLIEGDVADPAFLAALDRGAAAMRDAGYPAESTFSLPVVVRTFQEHPGANGATYADADGDGFPDSAADVRALLARALENGVYVTEERQQVPPAEGVPPIALPPPVGPPTEARVLAYAPETVREIVHPTADGGFDLTLLVFGIPETDDFANIPLAAADARVAAADVYAMEGSTLTRITLTGEPFKRFEQVTSITDSIKVSIGVSLGLCFVILLAAFRDWRYTLVTLIPVVLLVPWLYGFMDAAGLSLNLVTATIAAMAIGVGVDYSLHIAQRYREEIEINGLAASDALQRSMDSSGVALFGSATTTVLGFLVLLFAPMPLFQTFGFLTAVLAAAGFLAAATVLPPLLVLFIPRARYGRGGASGDSPVGAPPAAAQATPEAKP